MWSASKLGILRDGACRANRHYVLAHFLWCFHIKCWSILTNLHYWYWYAKIFVTPTKYYIFTVRNWTELMNIHFIHPCNECLFFTSGENKRKARKRRADGCGCSAKCARFCPCRDKNQSCGDMCHQHNSKCENKWYVKINNLEKGDYRKFWGADEMTTGWAIIISTLGWPFYM